MKTPGFTLIEMLATIAVAAILVTVAVPALSSVIAGIRTSEEANSFLSALDLAREKSVETGQFAVVCPVATGLQCAYSNGTATNWSNGWIVYSAPSATAQPTDPSSKIIRVGDPLSSGDTLIGAGPVVFEPNGVNCAWNGTTRCEPVQATVNDAHNTPAHRVCINHAGLWLAPQFQAAHC